MAAAEIPTLIIPTLTIPEFPEYLKQSVLAPSALSSSPTINIWHFIIGAYTSPMDFMNPLVLNPRNHECPQLVKNLMHQPGLQFSPAIIETFTQSGFQGVNIRQHLVLIDPMYSQKGIPIFVGLHSVYPDFTTNASITNEGVINTDSGARIKYVTTLEPVIIPCDVTESNVLDFIHHITSHQTPKPDHNPNLTLLINIMDCTSHVMRRTWIDNDRANIYIPMPNCLTNDADIAHLPIITSDQDGIRWCNYKRDEDLVSVYEAIAPNVHAFLINQYRHIIAGVYLLGWCKVSSRLRVTREYTLTDGVRFKFNEISIADFAVLWKKLEFQTVFMEYMDYFFAANIRRFINELLDAMHTPLLAHLVVANMQEVLIAFVKPTLAQLQKYFPKCPLCKNINIEARTGLTEFLGEHVINI